MSEEVGFLGSRKGAVVLTVASWEPRWFESVRQVMVEGQTTQVYALYSSTYSEWTTESRSLLSDEINNQGGMFYEIEADLDNSMSSWWRIVDTISAIKKSGISTIHLDGTTMPRETTWFCLHICKELRLDVSYSYVPAGSYGEWLSKESLQPRLVLKRSGIMFPDKPTCVLAMSGFDIGRLNQMVSYFEPARVEIARQTGMRYENLNRNTPQLSEYARQANIFDLDCFDLSGKNLAVLSERVATLIPEFNILVASLGPKAGSVLSFQLTESIPDVGLVYIPSRSYNREYSKGADISRRVTKLLKFS